MQHFIGPKDEDVGASCRAIFQLNTAPCFRQPLLLMLKFFLFSALIPKITWFYCFCLKACFSTLLIQPWSVSPSRAECRVQVELGVSSHGRGSSPSLTRRISSSTLVSWPWSLAPAICSFAVLGTLLAWTSEVPSIRRWWCLRALTRLAGHHPWSLATHLWKLKQAHQTSVKTVFLWREWRF